MRRVLFCTLLIALPALPLLVRADDRPAKPLRAGMIGLDTSHVIAFPKILNNPKAPPALAGCQIVAGYPGGSDDLPISRDRVKKFTQQLRDEFKIEIVESIDDLVSKVDVVFLESVDGRPHLQQIIPCLKAGKPVFIDKPIAGSLVDAIRIFELAKKYKVPVFSSSSYRFAPGVQELRKGGKVGKVLGCTVHGTATIAPHHPDLFFYGVHGLEIMYTLMGTGCEQVVRVHTKDTDVVVGTWKDGRVATYTGLRGGKTGFGGHAFGEKGITAIDPKGGYEHLLTEVVKFFRTREAPVSAEETLELFAFMEAADESKRQGGRPVTIAGVVEKARAEAAKSP